MRTTRCKFTVSSVEIFGYGGRSVKLTTQYDQSLVDQSFAKATPAGDMRITVDNPAAFDIFVPGKAVYVDITPVE